MATFIAHFVTM